VGVTGPTLVPKRGVAPVRRTAADDNSGRVATRSQTARRTAAGEREGGGGRPATRACQTPSSKEA